MKAAWLAAALALSSSTARADDDCGKCLAPEPGTDGTLGPLARVELGTAGIGVDDATGGRSVTAGLARVRFGVGIRDGLGIRASAGVQTFAAADPGFPFAGAARAGAALALGMTQRIGDTPLGLTLDGEVARGPAVRSGLGLRTLDDDRRITLAPGLAGAFDDYHATMRAHVRYLRDVDSGAGAVEIGAGIATRINWARDFWGGTWPLEMWVDYRYRRGLTGGPAREHEVRGGLDYMPGKWLDRVGVQLAGTSDRLDDDRRVHGLALIIGIQYGGGER